MTTIVASCPFCGQVELAPEQIELTICDPAARSTYTFLCPACRVTVRKPAAAHAITLLVSGGVAAHVLVVPLEALERHTGPPLTSDDLLDLLIDLEQL